MSVVSGAYSANPSFAFPVNRYRAPKLTVVSIGTTFGPYGVSLVVTHPAMARPSASTDNVLRSATMVPPIAPLSLLRAAHFGRRSTPTP
jgi:hypothetical protein